MEDYLKYWRVIRQYIKTKHGLTQADLDMILFMRTEGYFSKSQFDDFVRVVSWDEKRFKRLLADGWIESFRKYDSHTNTRALYNLSPKAKKMVSSIYKMLSGEEMPIKQQSNPMFKNNAKYMSKVYRNAIREMNSSFRQQRQRHAPE
jgi:hypothetical protein